MNTTPAATAATPPPPHRQAVLRAAIHDLAKRRAARLRRQAIDDLFAAVARRIAMLLRGLRAERRPRATGAATASAHGPSLRAATH